MNHPRDMALSEGEQSQDNAQAENKTVISAELARI